MTPQSRTRVAMIDTLLLVLFASSVVSAGSSQVPPRQRPATKSPAQQTNTPATQTTPAPSSTSQDSSPSLEETLNWIKDKLPREPKRHYQSFTIKVDSVVFDGCSFTMNSSSETLRFTNSVGLADLDPSNTKVTRTSDEYYVVSVHTVEKKPRVRFTAQGGGTNEEEMINYVGFSFRDEEIANRVARAFAHAIKLCKKKEPF